MKELRILIISMFVGLGCVTAQNIPYSDGSATNEKRGDAYFEQMSYVNALECYQKVLEKNPDDKGVQLKIAKCYAKLNNQEEVSYYSAQSLSDNSATAADVFAYAESLESIENYDKADRIYSRYASMNSGDSRTELKKTAIDDIMSYYEDSLAYYVTAAGFNSNQSDFGPAYKGDEIFFVSNRGKAKLFQSIDMRDKSLFLDMYKVDGSNAALIKKLSESLHEGPMSFYEDGKKVIMTTNHPFSKKVSEIDQHSKLKLVMYENGPEGWFLSSEFPHNNVEYSVGHPSYDESTNTLYFASNMPGGKGGVDLYSSEYVGGEWSAPVNLEELNTEGDEMYPFVQNRDIYFASNGRGGMGGLDIYKSKVSGGVIYTMGYPVNTSKDDFGMVLQAGGKKGYFSSNREGGLGSDDIYEVLIYRLTLEVSVVDQKTGEPIRGNLKIVDQRTGEEIAYKMVGDKAVYDGLRGRTYVITSDQEGYADASASFIADSKDEKMAVKVPMERLKEDVVVAGVEASYIKVKNLVNPVYYRLEPTTLRKLTESELGPNDKAIVIEDVYFNFDSDGIASGVKEIDKVIAILKTYPEVSVDITSYCDVRGSMKYNQKLAERRAQRVEDYMTANGIDADRIRSVSVGKAELYVNCEKCNEEQHQTNRRAEFTLNVE